MSLQIVHLCSLLPAVFCISISFAQQTLQGNITNDKYEPVIGAAVQLFQQEVFITQTSTDYFGNYKLDLDPSLYQVKFAQVGYQPKSIDSFIVKPGSRNRLDVQLNINENFVFPKVVTKCFTNRDTTTVELSTPGFFPESSKSHRVSKPD